MDKLLKYSYITVMQLYTLVLRVVEIVNTSPALEKYLLIKELVDRLAADNKFLEEVLTTGRSKESTKLLKEFDEIRDDAFLTLRDYIESCSRRRSKIDIKEAALRIYGLFEKHGKTLYTLGYSDQTAAMNFLRKDLELPEYKKDIETVKAGELYREMLEAQENFEKIYTENIKKEENEKVPKRNELVPSLKFNLMLLIKNIKFLSLRDKAAYSETERAIEETIEDIMTVAKTRKKKAEELDNQEE